MALTFQDSYTKAQRMAKNSNSDVLTQLKQDMNTGYHLFNAKLSRYFTRKQQFTNLIANQQIYQTPIDCVRVMGMTALVGSSYNTPIKEIRGEFEWRQIVSSPGSSNWPSYYFMLGSDELALYPTPSQTVTNGLRFYYQPADHDLSIDDTTSTSSGQTVTVTNGSVTVTASGSAFTTGMVGLKFQVTGIADLTWYEIVAATTSTLTLKSAYVGTSAPGASWRVGQVWIIPQEYHDAPIHYALGNYFSSEGNEARSKYHLGTEDSPGVYYQMVKNCKEDYSSSNESSVITSDDEYLNPWLIPPIPSP